MATSRSLIYRSDSGDEVILHIRFTAGDLAVPLFLDYRGDYYELADEQVSYGIPYHDLLANEEFLRYSHIPSKQKPLRDKLPKKQPKPITAEGKQRPADRKRSSKAKHESRARRQYRDFDSEWFNALINGELQ